MSQLLNILLVILLSSVIFFEPSADARGRSGRGSHRPRSRPAPPVHYAPIPSNLDNSVTAAEEARGLIYKHNDNLKPSVAQCPETVEAMAGKLKPQDIRIFGVVPLDRALEPGHPIKIQACVVADNDRDAAAACFGKYATKAYNILNPGNRQYSSTGRGEYNTNPDKYYYCIAESLNMIAVKQTVCSWIHDYNNRQLCTVPAAFRRPTSANISGGTTTAPGTPTVADNDDSDDDTNDDGLEGDGSDTLSRIMNTPLQPYIRIEWDRAQGNGDGSCRCNGELDCPSLAGTDISCMAAGNCPDSPEAETQNVRLRQEPASPSPGTGESSAPTTTQTPETLVQQCITNEQQKADSCKTSVEQLEQSCAQADEANRPINAATQAIGTLGGGAISASALSGQSTFGTCVQTGAMALGATEALRTTQRRCDGNAGVCDNCRSNQIQNFLNGCSTAAGYANFEALRAAKPELAQHLTDAQASLTTIYDRTTTTCSVRVPEQQSGLSRVLTGLGDTARAATSCACKTSSSGGTNCDTIPTIAACTADPTAAGCQAYSAPAACAVGSPGYNAATCGCIQNPSAPGCQQVAAAVTQSFSGNLAAGSGVSGFAGTSTGGFASGGGSGGSGSSSNFSDLSGGGGGGNGVSANLLNNIKQGEISAGAGATGAGVGGGGSGGGGGAAANDPAAGAIKNEDKGIKGLFNNAKTFLSNAFGGGSAKTAASKATGNAGLDPTRFKPSSLRGVPQRRDIASQNEKTLFELVNECANGLRCRSTTANEMMTGP